MDPNQQQSFIPKKPGSVEPSIVGARRASRGFFYSITSLIFFLSVIAALGVFGYEKYLNSRISKMENDLEAARQALDPDTIKSLSRANARIESAKEIIKGHLTLSNFFDLLEGITLQSLRFSNFNYASTFEKGITVQMRGEARDYKTVALQAETFAQNQLFKDPLFSDLDINESGNVIFIFKSQVDPSVLLYEKAFESGASGEENPSQ